MTRDRPKTGSKRNWLLASAAAILVVGVSCAVAASWAWRSLNQPLALPDGGLLFEVESGAALSTVTARLGDLGAFDRPWLLTAYARLNGDATRIRAGEYELEPGLSAIDFLNKLRRGDVYLHQWTIIEGWRFDEMLASLRRHPAIAAGSESGADIMAALGKPGEHPEGQFLPDTYRFPRGTTELALLEWAHETLWDVLDELWWAAEPPTTLSSPYEALILASIIEKESALASERARISGVFHERLRRGMRLQADPTVIYGLQDEFTGDITRNNLNSDTPYNTYTRAGLPPTPIALPGRASIEAALAPEIDGSLYFVATGEPDGSHAFSKTLEEHNAAVRRYLARQREAQ